MVGMSNIFVDTISDLLKHKPSGRQFNLHIYFLVHSLFGQNKLHGGTEYPLFAAQFVSDILSSMFFRDHQFDLLFSFMEAAIFVVIVY
jgi:hypothetical protein